MSGEPDVWFVNEYAECIHCGSGYDVEQMYSIYEHRTWFADATCPGCLWTTTYMQNPGRSVVTTTWEPGSVSS